MTKRLSGFGVLVIFMRGLGAIALALSVHACGSQLRPPDIPAPSDDGSRSVPIEEQVKPSICVVETSSPLADLRSALQSEEIPCVQSAIDRGASIETDFAYQGRPLHIAVRKGNLLLADYLLERGADIEAPQDVSMSSWQTSKGGTSLMIAIGQKNFEMTSLLIDHGADVSRPDQDGLTSLWWAVSLDLIELARLCLEKDSKQINDPFGQARLGHRAVQNGNLEMLRLLEKHGFDMDSRDGGGRTLLHVAASNGEVEIARTVLKYSPYLLNVRSSGSLDTPLHEAVVSSRHEMIRFLLEAGANPHAKDSLGGSALKSAQGRFGGASIFSEFGFEYQPEEQMQ